MKTQATRISFRRALPILILLAASLLAACAPTTSQPASVTASPQASPSTEANLPTETSLPPTPTPQPGKVLLITSAEAAGLEAVASEEAAAAGWTFETRPALQPGELTSEVRVVILNGAPANLSELLAAAPQAQFVTLAAQDVTPAPNLSVIRLRPENQYFVAGLIAALYAAEWRAGGLIPNDGPLGGGLGEAFNNGGRYFCGMCGPGWPLGVYYPQVAPLPAASDGAAWQAAAAGLFDTQVVNLFFLSAEAAKPEVFSYLQGKEQYGIPVRLIGVQPPPAELKDQWLVTVGLDDAGALRDLWSDIAAGQGGQAVDAQIVLSDLTDEESPGVGRMRLVEDLLKEMAAGRIYPLTVPLQ